MKAGRALILAIALSVSAPLFAAPAPATATVSAPVKAPSPATVLAPPSATSAAVLMARAFRPAPQNCDDSAPGSTPLITPASKDQVMCLYNPFKRDRWGLCPAFPPSPVMALPPKSPKPTLQPAYITGDQVDGIQTGVSQITGHVQLDQGDRRVTAEKMVYDSNTGLADAQQDVGYATPQLVLTGPTGQYDTNKGTGTFNDADFLLPLRHGHGTATVFNSLDNYHSLLFGVQYTTCPPGQAAWTLNGPDLKLDTSTNTGEMHDVSIDFFGVPIFWSPYLNFPISDDRKSGFLGAEFSFDVVDGLEMGAPYYLNLANNYDATLYPRIITKRGMQMGGEYRYLSEYNDDRIYASYLPHDQVADRERGQFSLKHDTSFNTFTDLNAVYNWVSDDYYFQDLGSDESIVSNSILERHVKLTYDDEQDWLLMGQFQDFQTINPFIPKKRFSYRRIPQLVLTWANNEDTTGALYGMYAEAVRFERELRIGAWRSDLKPSVGYPFTASSAYFTPTLAWRLTDYDLVQNTFTPNQGPAITVDDRHLSRALPIFDIDTGLYFDRQGDEHTETLEPRFYYLRVPYRDQSQLPIFDALKPQFSFTQLFTDNRFEGADRQGDANQLSYALTSRVLNSITGAQVLQFDIGQIRYFADRRVQLNSLVPTDTAVYSDVTADALYNLNEQWGVTYEQLWNPTTRETDLAGVLLQYHPGYHQVVNIGYQFRRPNIKQTDFSFDWPLARNWSMVGRWNYDIVHHITLEDLIGFEYDSCCWDFQILRRHYVTPSGKFDNVFFFELQLKGLVTGGRHLESLLERGILGYGDNDFDEPQQPEQPATQ